MLVKFHDVRMVELRVDFDLPDEGLSIDVIGDGGFWDLFQGVK